MQATIQRVFDGYPESAREPMLQIRQWVFDVAALHDLTLEESLKWGEPSYACKKGSPVRLGVREQETVHCCLFFNCQSSLVETFREVYAQALEFDGKRAIVLPTEITRFEEPVKHCVELALRYHSIKHLPLLGA